jgi:hypothetical protein
MDINGKGMSILAFGGRAIEPAPFAAPAPQERLALEAPRRFSARMLFWLKKSIAFWLMPLPVCLTLLAVGLWLTRSPRRAPLGRRLLLMGTALLALFTNKVVSRALISPLEARYPPAPELREGSALPAALAGCRYVVVLGSGHSDTPGWLQPTSSPRLASPASPRACGSSVRCPAPSWS